MIPEFLSGTGMVMVYFCIVAAAAFLLRKFTHIPDETFRKLLHCILLGSLVVWTFAFQTWYLSVLSALMFAVIVFPVLAMMEKIPGFSAFMNERKNGEMKFSLMLVFTMYAAVATFCWGCFGQRMLSLCCIYAWGYGDAAAALVGKKFGKHKISGNHIEGKKSLEGTIAMFIISFLTVLVILLIRGGMAWYGYVVTSAVTAAVTSVVELYSMKGRDTITCPLAAMSVLTPLLYAFGGLL